MPPTRPENGSGSIQRYRRPESVLVLVHTLAGQVLLLQRVQPDDFWQSVTGSLEPAESPHEAARRELLEETGLELDVHDCHCSHRFEIRPPWRDRYAPGVTHNLEYRFRVCLERPVEIRLDPAEHLKARWLEAEAAIELASSWTNRAAIREIALPLAGIRAT